MNCCYTCDAVLPAAARICHHCGATGLHGALAPRTVVSPPQPAARTYAYLLTPLYSVNAEPPRSHPKRDTWITISLGWSYRAHGGLASSPPILVVSNPPLNW